MTEGEEDNWQTVKTSSGRNKKMKKSKPRERSPSLSSTESEPETEEGNTKQFAGEKYMVKDFELKKTVRRLF